MKNIEKIVKTISFVTMIIIGGRAFPSAEAEVSGTPISPPYSIQTIVESKIWDVGAVIPIDLQCQVQSGKAAQIAVSVHPWVKFMPESSAENLTVTLTQTTLDEGASSNTTVPATLLAKGAGEFMVHFTIADEAGDARGQQTLFVIARDGKVSISGSDFRICEWQFIMDKYGMALDKKVDELPADLKEIIRDEYRAVRRERRIKAEQYEQQTDEEQNVSQPTTSVSNTKNGNTTFKAFWTASNGKKLSIVGAKVEVLNFSTEAVLESGYLELSGKYHDNLEAGGIFVFATPSVDYKVRITPKYDGALYGGSVVGSYDEFEVVDDGGTPYDEAFVSGKNVTEYTVPDLQQGDVGAGVWSVYHGVLDVAKGAKDSFSFEKGSSYLAYFPNDAGVHQQAGTYYWSGNVYIRWNRRESWDTLGHEFSHLIDAANDVVDDSPGGGHSGENQYNYTGNTSTYQKKDPSLQLAISEAFASWFGVGVTKLSPFKNLIPGVGDVKYQGSITYSLEKVDGFDYRGEDTEIGVQRLMWDWADKANNESRTVSGVKVKDRLSLGHAGLLSAMKNKNLKGIHELWQGKFLPGGDISKFNQQAADAAESLVFFGISPVLTAPAQNTELDLSSTNPNVKFKWVARDDTGHSDMNLDSYKLVLYNSDYSKVLFERPWSSDKEYALAKNDLTTIQNAMGGTLSDVKAVVFGKDTLPPDTGPYASNVVDLKAQGVNRWVVMVVDSSGSNTTTDPNNLRKVAAKETINRLASVAEASAQSSTPDRAAAIDFDSYVTVLSGFDDPPAVEPTIDQVNSSGGTDIAAGIDKAVELLENAQVNGLSALISGKATICVFTDGQNSGGPIPVIWSIATAISKGIRVHYGFLSPQIKGDIPNDSLGFDGSNNSNKGDPPYSTIEEAVLASGGVYGEIGDDESQLAFVDQMYRGGLTGSDSPDEGSLVGQVKIAGRLDDPLMPSVYYFNGQNTERVTVTVTGEDFDPEIYLLDADNNFIASDKNYEGDRIAEVTNNLPYTGEYKVEIFSKGGGVGAYSIFVDVSNAVQNVILDVTSDVTTTYDSWELDWSTSAMVGTITMRNDGGKSGIPLEKAFWYAIQEGDDIRLAQVSGTTNGLAYFDVTDQVEALLPTIGNGDLKLDVGESVTFTVPIFTRDRSIPDGHIYGIWADPPVGVVDPACHAYDENADNVIDDFEILSAIDAWKGGALDDFGLLETIQLWKAGGYSYDESSGAFNANE